MWTYQQSTGELCHNGKLMSRGYSGKGRGVNNPKLQGVQGIGPIPVGRWRITERYKSTGVGPYTLRLEAVDAKPGDDRHQATGRGAFRMHGDNVRGDRSASKGCIIMPRHVREKVWTSGDRDLEVIA